MNYAQIDEFGVCIAVSQLAGIVERENMIEIDNYDPLLVGKRWNNGSWVEIPEQEPAPEPIPETTDQKLARLEEQNLILMDALATTFEEIIELRAAIEGGIAT